MTQHADCLLGNAGFCWVMLGKRENQRFSVRFAVVLTGKSHDEHFIPMIGSKKNRDLGDFLTENGFFLVALPFCAFPF